MHTLTRNYHDNKLVITTFWKLLSNVLKLYALRSIYELHGWARRGRVLQNVELAQIMWAAIRCDNVLETRWTNYKNNYY